MNEELVRAYSPQLVVYPEISTPIREVTKNWRRDDRSPLKQDYWPRSIDLALDNSKNIGLDRIDIFPDVDRADRQGFWEEYYMIATPPFLPKIKGGYPVTMYAQEIEDGSYTVLQYWMFYVYNDWKATHEGDWESITVYLRNNSPIAVAASAHHGGYRLPWSMVKSHKTHPVIYVANGSHANYFAGGISYKTNVELFNASFPIGELPFLGSFRDYTTTEQLGVTLHPEISFLPTEGSDIENTFEKIKTWGSIGSTWKFLPSFIRKRIAGEIWEAPSSPVRKYRWFDPFIWLEKCVEAPLPFWLKRVKSDVKDVV